MNRRTKEDQRKTAACWLHGVVAALTQEGLDVGTLFQEAGLDLNALDDPDARFPTDKVNQLWHLAVIRSDNPAIGLAAARVPKPASFGVVGYAMMSAPDLFGLLARGARYSRLISDALTLTVTQEPDRCRLVVALLGDDQAVPWQRTLFTLLSILSFLRWVMVSDLRPLMVELTVLANADLEPYQAAFGCPLSFGAASNALLFSDADLARPLPTAQAQLANVHEQIAGEYLARLDRSTTVSLVRAAILKNLSDGEPRRAAVARALGMSERTLQRRLEAEDTSFRQILDDTHKDLAQQYIDRDDLSLADAAYVLGFNDQSSFFRAVKRWLGTTPRQYRLQRAMAREAGP